MLIDFRFLDERVEDVEDTVRAPHLQKEGWGLTLNERMVDHTWLASAKRDSSSSVFDLTFDRQTQKDWNW